MNMIQVLKRSTVVLASLFAMVAIVGCSETAPDYTSVADASGNAVKSIEFSADAENYYLTMSTSGQWTAVSDSDWCYFPKNGSQTVSGFTNDELEISVLKNETNDARVANVLISSGNSSYNIVVNQSAYAGYITLSAAYGEVAFDTTDYSFTFDSNLVVGDISSSAEWVEAIISGSTVVLAIDENSLSTRMAEITLASDDVTATYVLVQGGRDSSTLSLSQTSYTFEAGAATANTTYDVDITSNIAGVSYAVASSNEEWCKVEYDAASDVDTFTVSVTSDNATSTYRYATITVVATGSDAEFVGATTTLNIVQECDGAPTLLLSSDAISAAQAGGSYTVTCYADGVTSYNTTDSEMITNIGVANNIITITVAANTNSDSREGIVTIACQSGGEVVMQNIIVTQAGYGELDLMLSTTSVEVAATADSFTIAGYCNVADATITYLAPSASWCSGSNGSYSVEANSSLISRECSIGVMLTVGNEVIVKYVTVTQKGADATI